MTNGQFFIVVMYTYTQHYISFHFRSFSGIHTLFFPTDGDVDGKKEWEVSEWLFYIIIFYHVTGFYFQSVLRWNNKNEFDAWFRMPTKAHWTFIFSLFHLVVDWLYIVLFLWIFVACDECSGLLIRLLCICRLLSVF